MQKNSILAVLTTQGLPTLVSESQEEKEERKEHACKGQFPKHKGINSNWNLPSLPWRSSICEDLFASM